MNIKRIGFYKNGNYFVDIYDDGTKIRTTEDNEFIPDFPESFDCKITNQCDLGCEYCHEQSIPDGEHSYIDYRLLDSLMPYTEIAIGGGNPLSHPSLTWLLKELKNRKVIANITVNQTHFEKNISKLNSFVENDLIKGLGVSVTNITDTFINQIKQYPNLVVHIINGIITKEDFDKLSDNNLKILILGYKTKGRGVDYHNDKSVQINNNIKWLSDNLYSYKDRFPIISFDNLALKQLDIKSQVPEKQYKNCYMGDDGEFTLYVDLVKGEFATSSTSEKRMKISDYNYNIKNMFREVTKNETTN